MSLDLFKAFQEDTGGDDKKSLQLLLSLARFGASKELLAGLLDFALGKKLHKDHLRFLAGPIIQYQSSWQETTPKWMYEAIGYDRLALILDERSRGEVGWRIGPIELATVMYPATMDGPMQYEYAQLYLWASVKAQAFHTKQSETDIWQFVGGQKVKDTDVLTPDGLYHYAYKNLCFEIRRKVLSYATKFERQIEKAHSNSSEIGYSSI